MIKKNSATFLSLNILAEYSSKNPEMEFVVRPVDQISDIVISAGFIIVTWVKQQEKIWLSGSYKFQDNDGQQVYVSICVNSKNELSEIEFWRGDGVEIMKIPNFSEMKADDIRKK